MDAKTDEKPRTAANPLASHHVRPDEMGWDTARFPGCATKTLFFDKDTGVLTALFRMEPGAVLPDHEHVLIEQTYVLEGSLVDDEGECTAGNFVIRAKGSRHAPRAPNGCTMLVFFLKPTAGLQKALLKNT
jgi:anti-sigma factor ChrR (cupin superfamily)